MKAESESKMSSGQMMKALNLLAEQQDQMLKENNIRAYAGLKMKEASIFHIRAKEIKSSLAKQILIKAAEEAIISAMKINQLIETTKGKSWKTKL